jgi:cytochrome oxidase Cu insertion factor (SCO1/SenC/PrrC family)
MNDDSRGESVLSEDQRRDIFRDELRLTTETGAGRIIGRIPQKFTNGILAAMVVLGGGGVLVEHYFGNVGLPTSSTPTTFTTPSTIPLLATTTVPSVISASQAFIGLKFIGTARVPHFTLTDQHGATVTSATRGKVVIIAFFNKNCNDICPVLGAELRGALGDLGAKARNVEVDIINTDPFSYAVSRDPLALVITKLSAKANVHFLSGPLTTLNNVWTSFGIQVNVGVTANEVSHNSSLYFVSPTGELSAMATPFAHQSSTGVFSLSSTNVAKFARGIELEAVSLMP